MFHGVIKEKEICKKDGLPVILQAIDDDWAKYCIQYAGSGFYCQNWEQVLETMRERGYASKKWVEEKMDRSMFYDCEEKQMQRINKDAVVRKSVSMHDYQWKKIEEEAKRVGMTQNEVIRTIVSMYFGE